MKDRPVVYVVLAFDHYFHNNINHVKVFWEEPDWSILDKEYGKGFWRMMERQCE